MQVSIRVSEASNPNGERITGAVKKHVGFNFADEPRGSLEDTLSPRYETETSNPVGRIFLIDRPRERRVQS